MKKIFYTLVVYIACHTFVKAQYTFISNEYLVNKFALSPAFAGLDKASDVFVSYRENFQKFDNAPMVATLSANTPLGIHHGLGVKVQSTKTGIFNNINTSFTYAYHVKTSEKSTLSFGVAAGIKNYYIDLSDPELQNDPYIGGGQMINRSLPDLDFGIDFTSKTFSIGFSIPQLNEGVVRGMSSPYYNSQDILIIKRQYRGYLMKSFVLDRNWQAQPVVVINKTTNYLMYDVNALLKFRNQLWIGGSYKSNNAIGAMIGMQYKRLVFNYTYEFSSKGILGASRGNNDISIGFLIGKNNPKLTDPTILKSLQCKPPYTNWQ